jgi:hypothetical protein
MSSQIEYQISHLELNSKFGEERKERVVEVAGDFWDELRGKVHHVEETAGECKYLIHAKVNSNIVGAAFLGNLSKAKWVFDTYQRKTTPWHNLSFTNMARRLFNRDIEIITKDFKIPENPIYGYSLYVSHKNREQGMGGNLVRASIEHLKRSNHDTLVSACELGLCDFYENLGLTQLMRDKKRKLTYFAIKI